MLFETGCKLIYFEFVPVTLSLSDENFGKLVSGKTKAQNLFMSGKLKVKGNVMKGKPIDLTGFG